ncbi:MAG: hypothetical protein F6K50_02635 [Moorea sp. SIO3I7]|nr:hypothetical protein [Moorena sp. SIO3I7]
MRVIRCKLTQESQTRVEKIEKRKGFNGWDTNDQPATQIVYVGREAPASSHMWHDNIQKKRHGTTLYWEEIT